MPENQNASLNELRNKLFKMEEMLLNVEGLADTFNHHSVMNYDKGLGYLGGQLTNHSQELRSQWEEVLRLSCSICDRGQQKRKIG